MVLQGLHPTNLQETLPFLWMADLDMEDSPPCPKMLIGAGHYPRQPDILVYELRVVGLRETQPDQELELIDTTVHQSSLTSLPMLTHSLAYASDRNRRHHRWGSPLDYVG